MFDTLSYRVSVTDELVPSWVNILADEMDIPFDGATRYDDPEGITSFRRKDLVELLRGRLRKHPDKQDEVMAGVVPQVKVGVFRKLERFIGVHRLERRKLVP